VVYLRLWQSSRLQGLVPRTARLHQSRAQNSCRLSELHSIAIENDLLQGARHAVLGTLCARAHRIELDGTSCLLDGLRKNVSFSFFVVVVVCVLACPASEVLVLAEQQLQGLGDHV